MAILATQRVPTLDYWKFAHQLVPGDVVFDQNGNLVKITSCQTYRASECFEVEFSDFLTMAGDSHLGFLVEDFRYRVRSDK